MNRKIISLTVCVLFVCFYGCSNQTITPFSVYESDKEVVAIDNDTHESTLETTTNNVESEVIVFEESCETYDCGLEDGIYLAVNNYDKETVYEWYEISEDLTYGSFFIESFVSFSQEEIDEIMVGDSITFGNSEYVVENIQESENSLVSLTLYAKDCDYSLPVVLVQQTNGDFYLTGDNDEWFTYPIGGMYQIPFSDDLKIYDNCYVLWGNVPGEDPYGYETTYTLAEFKSMLDKNAEKTPRRSPELYVRITHGYIDLIVINPFNHQPWYDWDEE